MIFFDQFKVPMIKFGKCFAELMIHIAVPKKFGSLEFVTIIEVSNMRRCSGKANKLRYIPHRGEFCKKKNHIYIVDSWSMHIHFGDAILIDAHNI